MLRRFESPVARSRLRWLLLPLLVALLPVLLSSAPLRAQDGGAGDPASNLAVRQDAEAVPDSQKAERAAQWTATMKAKLKKMLDAMSDARDGKDAVKLGCVTEKLTQAKGLLAVGESAEMALQEHLSRRDREEIDHAFSKLSIAQEKAEQLAAEADSCIGESAVYSGDTVVEVESNDTNNEDPTSPSFVPAPVQRPLQVSPYQ